MRWQISTVLLLAACSGSGDKDDVSQPTDGTTSEPEESLVVAIVDADRPEHYFDVPFPSDALLTADGTPDLNGYPLPEPELAASVLGSWIDRIEKTSVGFGNNTAAYFRFEAELEVPVSTEGAVDDPVLWVALDGSEILPLTLRFVADASGDPYYGDNTLALAPTLGNPPLSGMTYAAVVMRSAGVAAPEGYELPAGVAEALAAAGVTNEPAVATVFTVQDGTAQLKALAADVEPRLDFGEVTYRRVVELAYRSGETPSGKEATLAVATFEGGETSTAYLAPSDPFTDHVVDLGEDWPMMVWEAELPVWNYQGLEGRPYMSPGLAHIGDIEEQGGWIDFDGDQLLSVPELEMMRFTVSLPKDPTGEVLSDVPVIQFDHGTSGHAYNIVQRRSVADNGLAVAERFAEAGYAVIGRDAPLYGTRYPLIDTGHGGSLGFYNIVNAPAFRDNQRQTAIDGYVLRRYIDQQLNADLPLGSVDASRVRRMGHSLGSVTSNIGMAMAPQDYEAALLSGTGGVFLHYFFDTGLLQDIDPGLISSLFPLFGAVAPDEVTTVSVLGAVLGLDQQAWGQLDRLHPSASLFQWQMDPSDPMALARSEAVPITAVIAPGDWQTPDFTAEALVNALPDARAVTCNALGSYDPHYCLWRETEGFDHLEDWLAE